MNEDLHGVDDYDEGEDFLPVEKVGMMRMEPMTFIGMAVNGVVGIVLCLLGLVVVFFIFCLFLAKDTGYNLLFFILSLTLPICICSCLVICTGGFNFLRGSGMRFGNIFAGLQGIGLGMLIPVPLAGIYLILFCFMAVIIVIKEKSYRLSYQAVLYGAQITDQAFIFVNSLVFTTLSTVLEKSIQAGLIVGFAFLFNKKISEPLTIPLFGASLLFGWAFMWNLMVLYIYSTYYGYGDQHLFYTPTTTEKFMIMLSTIFARNIGETLMQTLLGALMGVFAALFRSIDGVTRFVFLILCFVVPMFPHFFLNFFLYNFNWYFIFRQIDEREGFAWKVVLVSVVLPFVMFPLTCLTAFCPFLKGKMRKKLEQFLGQKQLARSRGIELDVLEEEEELPPEEMSDDEDDIALKN